MKIGNARLVGKFVLAPMADRTDIAFRHVCRKCGAALTFCEFASAEGVLRNEKYALKIMRSERDEKPLGVQIFGENAGMMGQACKRVNEMREGGLIFPDLIDLNFGCPGRNVVGAGAGSALLKSPQKIAEIVQECVKNSEMPVTAKIRMDGGGIEKTVELAKLIEDAGAAAITVHARTVKTAKRKDGIDWSAIARVKGAISVPVIGNGGADTWEKACLMLEETGCDFVMVARGALYNPFIFAHANERLEGKEISEDLRLEKGEAMKSYLEFAEKFGFFQPGVGLGGVFKSGAFGDLQIPLDLDDANSVEFAHKPAVAGCKAPWSFDLRRAKIHAMEFCFGLDNAKGMRTKISRVKNAEELEAVFHGGSD